MSSRREPDDRTGAHGPLLSPHGTGKPGSTGPIRSSTTSVSTRFRQIQYPALGRVRARGWPKHEDRQRAGVLGIQQRGGGAEIGDAHLGAWSAEEALADVRNAPDLVLPDPVRVDLDVEFDAGRPGILRERRERGFEKGSWDAGTRPTSLGGRGLGAGEEFGVPDPAGPDPFRYPVPEPVGFDRTVLVVCSFHCVAFRFRAALTWCPLAGAQRCGLDRSRAGTAVTGSTDGPARVGRSIISVPSWISRQSWLNYSTPNTYTTPGRLTAMSSSTFASAVPCRSVDAENGWGT